MPRKRTRKENKPLPARWRFRHGAYYYDVPSHLREQWNGKREFRLGTTLPEAYAEWAKRLKTRADVRTIGQLLDRYALEVVPTKAPKTQEENTRAIANLRAVFGEMLIEILSRFTRINTATDAARRREPQPIVSWKSCRTHLRKPSNGVTGKIIP
jgi:hypothetical protein